MNRKIAADGRRFCAEGLGFGSHEDETPFEFVDTIGVEEHALHVLKLVHLVVHNCLARRFMEDEVPAIPVSKVSTS